MLLARFQDYEVASQKVLEQLGYEIVGLDVFCRGKQRKVCVYAIW